MAPLKTMISSAKRQADLLRSNWPACGHLLHMASHIDCQLGDYQAAIDCNRVGIEQDIHALKRMGTTSYYHGYRIHNHHMLVFAAMFCGQFQIANQIANEAVECTPPSMLEREIEYMEPYLSDIWHVLIRFGKWQEILDRPISWDVQQFPVWTTLRHYARALAYSSLGMVDTKDAVEERKAYTFSLSKVPNTRYLHNVKSLQMFEVASAMLEGETQYRRGQFESAFSSLRKAVELDDSLPYDEPWGWMVPARHALGALLFEYCKTNGGAYTDYVYEAADVYRQDLQRYPKNIWALTGLEACLRYIIEIISDTGKHQSKEFSKEYTEISQLLKIARLNCDQNLRDVKHSCFCAGMGGGCRIMGKD
jgi:tetratricopeptide (TPR) repeat protein